MKILSLFLVFVFLLSSTVSAQEKKNPLEGAWQLVDGKFVSADTTEIYSYSETPSDKNIKIIGKKHFATIWQDTIDTSMGGFNGGTYTFENDIYTEHLFYFSLVDMIGIEASFKVKIEEDRLFLNSSSIDGEELEFGWFQEWKRLE